MPSTTLTAEVLETAAKQYWHKRCYNVHTFRNVTPRDSPDDNRSAMNIRRELRTATDTSGIQNGGRVANLAMFAGIWTHSSRRLLVNA